MNTAMPSTMMPFALTIDHMIERARRLFAHERIVSRRPDKTLLHTNYAVVLDRAQRLARACLAGGLRPGDRVATLMWNHHYHLEAYLGLPLGGLVMHTLNLRLFPDDVAYTASHAEDRWLLVDDILLPVYERFKALWPFEKVFVVPFGESGKRHGEYGCYEALLQTAADSIPLPAKKEEDALGLCYTSGTTGRPKGVVYSHRSTMLHAMAMALPDYGHLERGATVTPVVPMFHANAWGLPYSATLVGCRQVFPGPHVDAASLLDLFESEQVTMAAGVPTIWMALLQALDAAQGQRWKLPVMRLLVGGSAAPEGLIRGLDRHSLHIHHLWGMTETSPMATAAALSPRERELPLDEQYKRRARQGIPAPLVELRLMDDNGTEAPWDDQAMGEIQVRGPWITGGYLHEGATHEKFTADGWLRTGDIASCDEQGSIRITDRTKDLIKSGGEWISSVALENLIMGHPAVAEAAVIAMPHPKWDERPLAIVVLKPGQSLGADELLAFMQPHVASWWLPDEVILADEIPRTSTGKFNKLALRERYAAGKTP